jgi:hypothetical protein
MRLALAILCIGAVLFLMRFLLALLGEVLDFSRSQKTQMAKWKPPRTRGKLISMRVHNRSADANRRIAL